MAMAEKAQFGNLLKIAPFCGMRQWHLQSRDGSDGYFLRLALAPEGSCPLERILLTLRRCYVAEDICREDYKSCMNQIKKSEFIQKKNLH